MINNLNLNTIAIKSPQHTNENCKSVSFCGSVCCDKFEKSGNEQLSHLERLTLYKLNANREKNDKLVLSKKTLEEINDAFILKTSKIPYSHLILGNRAAIQSIREYLISNANNKNTFQLTLIQDMIHHSMRDIAKASGFSEIFHKDGLQQIEANFKKFLGILYINEGQDTVNKFLSPYIREAAYTKDARKLACLAKEYFKEFNKKFKNIKTEVIKRNDGRFTAKVYVDEKLRALKTKHNREHAISAATHKVLEEEGMLFSDKDKKICMAPVRYAGNQAAKEEAEAVLKDMYFLPHNKSLDIYKDANLIEHINFAKTPTIKINNSMNFQLLEFLGDAVTNTHAAKFITEKNLDKETADKFYCELVSNDTFKRFAENLNIPKHINVLYNAFDAKISADTFEAVMGALHLHFPSERIYSYLKVLFEIKYKEFMANSIKQVI